MKTSFGLTTVADQGYCKVACTTKPRPLVKKGCTPRIGEQTRLRHTIVRLVEESGGFPRKLFQAFYSEFNLEIVHDSKYVTWMFLTTKHFRSNILAPQEEINI